MLLSACKDDVANAGSSALMEGEDVVVRSDTLDYIISSIRPAAPAWLTPDSFMLGECRAKDYGTLKADLLTQFACPEGWVFPEASVLDSVCLYIYYTSWCGDGNAPLGITAYPIDREPLSIDSLYGSTADISRFCSLQSEAVRQGRVISAAAPADSLYSSLKQAYVPYVCMRLTEDYEKLLFDAGRYDSQEQFNTLFPGLYITTSYGASTALYVSSMCLTVHYHYTYADSSSPSGTKTMADHKILYANSEVAQVCRYQWPEREQVIDRLRQDTAANYILSPANIYTRLNIPVADILDSIRLGVGENRHAYVNKAQLRIDVLNGGGSLSKEDNWAAPSRDMMLVSESAFNEVFRNGLLPGDTVALYASLTSSYDADSARYYYYYPFDMASLFTELLRGTPSDTLHMVLVPVDVAYTSSSSSSADLAVSSVRLKQTLTATKIRSARSPEAPMDIEFVYCGFTDTRIGE